MQRDLGYSAAQLTGAFSLALGVSAVAGIAVGRHLDRHSPRALMTAGSIAGTVLVVAWSQVARPRCVLRRCGPAIGLVMAAVLYEPAFTVVAKHFPERRRAAARDDRDDARRRARQLHLPAALPGADRRARLARRAARARGGILAAVTIPLHALVLRPRRDASAPPRPRALDRRSATRCARSAVLAALRGLRARLAEHDRDDDVRDPVPARARPLARLRRLRRRPDRRLADPRAAAVRAARRTPAARRGDRERVRADRARRSPSSSPSTRPPRSSPGWCCSGMGNGMATLARATAIADLYGSGAYGTIAGVAGGMTTAARAAGPFAAARLRRRRRLHDAAVDARRRSPSAPRRSRPRRPSD